jgi:hypothetical protein
MLPKYQSFGRLKEEEYEEVVVFSIDGPGGERIETIKMRHYYADPREALPWMVQEGTMVRCKVIMPPSPHPVPVDELLTAYSPQDLYKPREIMPPLQFSQTQPQKSDGAYNSQS